VALVPARFAAGIAAGAIGLMYVDVTSFAQPFLRAREAPVDDREDLRFVADLPGDVSRDWRVYDEFVMEQRPGSRLRVRDLRGYPSGDPFDDARYSAVRARLAQNPELLGAYNVRWLLHGPHHRNGKSKNHIAQPPDQRRPQHFKKLDGKRWEVVGAAPLVLWYAGVQLAQPAQALSAVVAQEQSPGQRRLAIVEPPDVPASAKAAVDALTGAGDASPLPVAGTLVDYGANRIAVSVDAPAAGLVVLNEKMAAGWTVSVDGRAAPALRANYMLRAVAVPAGHHDIVWSYSPPGFLALFLLWLAGVAFVVAAGVSAWRSRAVQQVHGGAGQQA
jgi:hypothetical protein